MTNGDTMTGNKAADEIIRQATERAVARCIRGEISRDDLEAEAKTEAGHLMAEQWDRLFAQSDRVRDAVARDLYEANYHAA